MLIPPAVINEPGANRSTIRDVLEKQVTWSALVEASVQLANKPFPTLESYTAPTVIAQGEHPGPVNPSP